jgi:hypothetical protein
MATNRGNAYDWLRDAEMQIRDSTNMPFRDAGLIGALLGIRYALLEVADSFRDIAAIAEPPAPGRPS